MITNTRTFYLGIFLLLIPLLGLPLSWKFALVIISGIVLIVLSVKIDFTLEVPTLVQDVPDARPPKAVRRPRKKEHFTSESLMVEPSQETDTKTVL